MVVAKRIRVLCLHGMGDNAAIFRAQTYALRQLLPASYDFVFIEGEDTCDPPPGVDQIYPGPYRCWFSSPSTAKVARAHAHVRRTIDKLGPFDVVMGFSQGAALAASIILQHRLDNPKSLPLFKGAIFLSAPLPFSVSVNCGIDARTDFSVRRGNPLNPARPNKVPSYLKPSDPFYLQPDSNESFYQMFHHTSDKVRMNIPTAHVYGRKDKLWRRHAMDLVELGGGKLADRVYVYEHDGAHEIPSDEAEEICDTIEMVVSRAGLA